MDSSRELKSNDLQVTSNQILARLYRLSKYLDDFTEAEKKEGGKHNPYLGQICFILNS
jgi:hypothetical protein